MEYKNVVRKKNLEEEKEKTKKEHRKISAMSYISLL